jgi:hypothetical protein
MTKMMNQDDYKCLIVEQQDQQLQHGKYKIFGEKKTLFSSLVLELLPIQQIHPQQHLKMLIIQMVELPIFDLIVLSKLLLIQFNLSKVL